MNPADNITNPQAAAVCTRALQVIKRGDTDDPRFADLLAKAKELAPHAPRWMNVAPILEA